MSAPAPFLGPVGTSAHTDADTSHGRTRLTRRGTNVAAVLIGIALGGAIWLASAIGFWLTGVSG